MALMLALPSDGNPGQPSYGPVEPVVYPSAFITPTAVTFALPGQADMTFVLAYIRENDESLSAVRQRSKRPFRIIESILQKFGLPAELKYLAVIESDLKATALSRVGAKGPWQLMASTAQDLGLTVDSNVDERTNLYKSTRAAALYLRDLHRAFKDWLLVLAAYNAGPLPVYRAIRRSNSSDFRVLERYLPAESRQHVRRFLATAYYFDGPVTNAKAGSAGDGRQEDLGYRTTLKNDGAHQLKVERRGQIGKRGQSTAQGRGMYQQPVFVHQVLFDKASGKPGSAVGKNSVAAFLFEAKDPGGKIDGGETGIGPVAQLIGGNFRYRPHLYGILQRRRGQPGADCSPLFLL